MDHGWQWPVELENFSLTFCWLSRVVTSETEILDEVRVSQLPCFPNMIRIPLGWKSAFWDRWKGTSRLGWQINWNPPIFGKLNIMVSCRFSMIFPYASPLRTVYREVHIVCTFKRCSSCSRPTNFWTVASWKLLVASQICQNLLTVVILCADLQIVQFPIPTTCIARRCPSKTIFWMVAERPWWLP